MTEATSRDFQILSLSGGGYLGLYTAIVLEEIEKKLERPLAQSFDCVAGTSIGGLLALAIALEVPMERGVRLLKESGTEIFSSRKKARGPLGKLVDLSRSFISPKYGNYRLGLALDEIYGPETRIGDIPNNIVLVPTVNLTLGKAQVLKTPHLREFERDWKLRVRDVALATSAAPTYFPIAEVGEQLFADGGLYANSPDLIAIHEAEHFLKIDRQSIRLLSIGTTTADYSLSHETGTNFGLINWALEGRLGSAMIAAQQQNVHYMTEHILGERYLRIDTVQSKEQERELALDIASRNAQRTICGLAEGAVRQNAKSIGAFLTHQSRKSKFYFGPNSEGVE